MADDFKVGDLALCINDAPCPVLGGTHSCKKGRVYRVSAVKSGKDRAGRDVTGLKGVGLEAELYRNVICFRKLDAPRTEIADRIRACQPSRSSVPA